MLINVGYDISFDVVTATPVVLMLDVHGTRRHDLRQEHDLIPPPSGLEKAQDIYGNNLRRFVAPQGRTSLSYRAIVSDSGELDDRPDFADEVPVAQLPAYALHFLGGSRYCETDNLSAVAWHMFGKIQPGLPRVQAICDFVHGHLRFDYQQARSTRTAIEAYNERVGVCRDFTHLAIALCRCLNIPARYVNGYLGDIGVPADPAPMDFSAWFEVYIGHQWVTFDARHNARRTGRIVIARGRDATDVPMITSFGTHILSNFQVVTHEIAPSDIETMPVAVAA